jgi:hypothetical protein
MKYKVGDKVRVRRDLEEYGQYGKYGANRNMAELHGSIVEIKKVENEEQRYEINDNLYYWTDEMFEGLAENELTAEEAFKTLGDMCARGCKACELGKLVKESGYLLCGDYGREHPDKVVEILKQRKKEHEKKEVETEFTWCVLIIEADTHTLKHEEKVGTDFKSIDAKKAEILKKYCSEHDGKYYAISERRCVVKE